MSERLTGIVKWYNPAKGFGFLVPDVAGRDIFVHVSAVEKSGLKGLDEGQRVEYELQTRNGKSSAVNLKVLA